MSLGELETAIRLWLPILVVVLNDGAYHAEVQGLRELGQPTDSAYHREIDFGAVARSLGASGAIVRTVEDLEKNLSPWLAAPGGPLVLDCKIPCPVEYWADQEWLEDFWSQPLRSAAARTEKSGVAA
jgi:thiamine pyrophosphate-dependent acetolactate synthase large subunit-like protein